MEGLGSGPWLKIRGFQCGPSLKNEGDFGTKNNKETYIFSSPEPKAHKVSLYNRTRAGVRVCVHVSVNNFKHEYL